jgi:hypothetical protein
MPTNSKPRRKNAQRRVIVNAQARAMGVGSVFTANDQLAMGLPPRTALEALRGGFATVEHFNDLAMTVNIALICAERIGPRAEAVALAGRDALLQVHQRHARAGKWGFAGGEAAAVASVLDIYDQLLDLLNAGQMRAAVAEYTHRVHAGEHFGKNGKES